LFPRELMAEVEELNRDFIREQRQRQKFTPTVPANDRWERITEALG
jgi:hypothetical protein